MLKGIITAILFVASTLCLAQPSHYRFHTYGQTDGLNSPTVYAIVEDSYGFLWVGTEDGLYRFDGSTFTSFRRTADRHQTLVSNSITALLANGPDLWVGTREGLMYFDGETQSYQSVWEDEPLDYVSAITYDGKEGLWIGTRNGLYHYDIASKKHRRYMPENGPGSISSERIFDLLFDSQDRLWVSSSRGGLNLYQPETDDFQTFRHDPQDPGSLSSDILRHVAEAPDGRILVGTNGNGLNILDPNTFKITHYDHEPDNPHSLSARSVYSFLVDRDDRVWIGTWTNGVNLFDLRTGKSTRFTYNPDDQYSLPHNSIQCLMQSSSGDLWVGTDDGGLARLTFSEQRIVRYLHDTKDKNSLLTNYVRSVYEDPDGTLWIGTAQHGLHRYDRESGIFRVYLESDGSRDGKARGTIWSISPGDGDILWLGTSRGVAKFNKSTEKVRFFEPDPNNPQSISTNNIMSVLDDRKGNLWIGTWAGGLNRMDIEEEVFEHFLHDENNPVTLSNNNVGDILIDKQDRLWVSNGSYLHLMNDDRTFTRFPIPVLMMRENHEGDLWLATGDGLALFSTKEKMVSQFLGVMDGLSSDSFLSVLLDHEGHVWAGSTSGIDRYDPVTGAVLHLDKGDGLAGNNLNTRTCYFSPNSGKIFVGGIQGLSEIYPDDFYDPAPYPDVRLTNLLLFNEVVEVQDSSILKQSIYASDQITLDYSDYIFAFEFAALSFDQPRKIQYQYKLAGFDNDWINTNAMDRKAVYTNVPHGDYVFQVRASNPNGAWNDQFTSIRVSIIPPWWKTWWAQSMFYLSLIAVGALVVRVRMSVIKQQKKVLEAQVRERSAEIIKQKEELEVQAEKLVEVNKQKNKLFSIISHDLRSPLNSLSAINELLDPQILTSEELTKFKANLSARLDDVSEVMVNLLSWAKSQMEGEVQHPESFVIDDLVSELVPMYASHASRKKVTLVNRVNNGHQVYADKNQVRVILRNLIGNAIKFTPANGTIEIDSNESNNETKILVRDSGVGMTPDQIDQLFTIQTNLSTRGTEGEKGVGLGLLLVKEFVEKNDGLIQVESASGKGSVFKITLRRS